MTSINTSKKYQSKLLLFGEHAILKGSQALAMPLSSFYGRWAYSTDTARQMNLKDFANYLKHDFPNQFNIAAFKSELENGLFFDSNIPTGYGVGSSGALVAAVFDTFIKEKKYASKQQLQAFLGKMESFFHGASSGIDPLICYLEENILLEGTAEMKAVDLPNFSKKNNWTIFLLDTQMPRKTGPFVELFLNKCNNKTYEQLLKNQLSPITKTAITCFLNGEWASLFEHLHHISKFQEAHFSEMIPPVFKPIWKAGIDHHLYKLKLCGAGGGGFLLGMTQDFQATKKALANWTLQVVW